MVSSICVDVRYDTKLAVYVGIAHVQLKFELESRRYVPLHVFRSCLKVLEALPMICQVFLLNMLTWHVCVLSVICSTTTCVAANNASFA